MSNHPTHRRMFFVALDPVHIGAGGHRLSRVDMTIVREPGTNLPKIPGTSLAGAARSYSAALYGRPEAAGQHSDIKGPERTKPCPILYTFGTTLDHPTTGEAQGTAGTVSIGDALVLFFPIYSRYGPVWASTPGILETAGFQVANVPAGKTEVTTTIATAPHRMNAGWLLLDVPKPAGAVKPLESLAANPAWKAIQSRLVILHDEIFPQVVNSGLEVRTSVSIDPLTGAAAKGALFTYEAIPRGTWLFSDVIEDDYRKREKERPFPRDKAFDGKTPLQTNWDRPLDLVQSGLAQMKLLGVGGMGTRGFGRLSLAASQEIG